MLTAVLKSRCTGLFGHFLKSITSPASSKITAITSKINAGTLM